MTVLWDVQAALKDLFVTAAPTATVVDAADLLGDDPAQLIQVGELGKEGDTATATRELSPMGNGWDEEAGEVPCRISVWTGETDPAAPRATAKLLLTACVAAVRADRSLGGVLPATGLARVSAVRLREGQTAKGVLIEAGFTVSYTALLT